MNSSRESAAREQWIPCAERLPELGDDVLIAGGNYVGCGSRCTAYPNGEYWDLGHCALKLAAITHWRPLPAAPFAAKGETE